MGQRPLTSDMIPQLAEWFDYNIGTGCSPAQLGATLVESGFRSHDVDRFIAAQQARLAKRGDATLYDAEPVVADDVAARLWNRLDVINAFNQVNLGDRTVSILARSPRNGITLIAEFLSDAECATLIGMVEGRMSDSAVLNESDGETIRTASRSSRGALIDRGATEIVRRIESRVAKLTALPIVHGEALQLLHYGVGGEYRPHLDYFDPETVGGARALARNSQRAASLILYLSEVEGGGATQFPKLGLEFMPIKGGALLFPSIDRHGQVMPESLHAGAPVVSGEKWIATKWLRLTPQGRSA